ncbi:integrase [Streptomyces prasinus]
MLLRLAYLTVTNAFAVLRLLPMSDRDMETEILALRHQTTVLERQLGGEKVRFSPNDRAFLAALLHRPPSQVLRRIRLVERPDTVLRRHRDLVARRHAATLRGLPGPSAREAADRVLRPAAGAAACPRELPPGVPPHPRRIPRSGRYGGRLHRLGNLEEGAGIESVPERASSTWAGFLRSPADALLACDFFEMVTLSGARWYVFAAIEHANRRIRILGATAHPTASWVVQAAENLVMDLEDAGCRARFLIRDRDGKFPRSFDEVLKHAGIEVVLSGVRIPRMNSIWSGGCRPAGGNCWTAH